MWLSDIIRQAGFRTICAVTAHAACADLRLHGAAIDALVTDVNPGGSVSGFELARFARSVKPRMPVIYVSGLPEEVTAEGVQDAVLLQKPIDAALLISTLRRLLAAAESIEEPGRERQ